MAKYDTDLRNTRQQALLDRIQGGTVYLCSGSPPSALAVPAAGSILSQHLIAVAGGTVDNGQMVLADGDVDPDTEADNGGTITYVVAVKDSIPIARWLVPSQMSVSINGGSSLTIVAGLPVDVDSMTVNEGNA